MKPIPSVLVVMLLIGFTCLYRFLEWESRSQIELFRVPSNRPAITFILGRDKEGQHYFDLAEKHFLLDSGERTDLVVKSCHSLESLIGYLNRHSGDKPWGIINIVVHGNMWGGLSVAMTEEGNRAYPKDLFRTVSEDLLPVPGSRTIDSITKINIWACGIGKNPILNVALEMLFTNEKGERPQIYASPYFVIFKEVPGRLAPVRINASYWPYFFKRGYRPSESVIINQLKNQYPDLSVNWKTALNKEKISEDDREFHDEFQVPVVWTVLYPSKEARPAVSTEEEKELWIKSQPELMQKLEDLEIPIDKYHWTVNKILYKHPDGEIQPAIKAIGMCTVLCVLSAEGP